MNTPGGKGSAPRPLSVDHDTYTDNWDRIFRKPIGGAPHRPDRVCPCLDCIDYFHEHDMEGKQ